MVGGVLGLACKSFGLCQMILGYISLIGHLRHAGDANFCRKTLLFARFAVIDFFFSLFFLLTVRLEIVTLSYYVSDFLCYRNSL